LKGRRHDGSGGGGDSPGPTQTRLRTEEAPPPARAFRARRPSRRDAHAQSARLRRREHRVACAVAQCGRRRRYEPFSSPPPGGLETKH
jgi:hypothetical protein